MGKFTDKQKAAATDALLNSELENDKIESLKEVLNLLSQVDDGNTKIGGVINDAADARITAALGENGDITTAISGAITAAIGEGGAIETWGDNRYQAKG